MIVITDGMRANNCLILRPKIKALSFRSAAGAEEPAFAGGEDIPANSRFLSGFTESE
jgi:hypothetical protein